MEALIKKAIDAIKSDKKEYAMGLLEGALEMTAKQFEPNNVVDNKKVGQPITYAYDDEIGELDASRLNQIKSTANIEILK